MPRMPSRPAVAVLAVAVVVLIAGACGGDDAVPPAEIRPQLTAMCEAVAAVDDAPDDDVVGALDVLVERLDVIEATYTDLPAVEGMVDANRDRGLEYLDAGRTRAVDLADQLRVADAPVDPADQSVVLAQGLIQGELDGMATAFQLDGGGAFRGVVEGVPACATVIRLADGP